MATLTPSPIWHRLLEPRLSALTVELDELLGPTISDVTITTTPTAIVVTVDPLSHRLSDVAWQVCVQLSPLWPDTFAGAHVNLVVTDSRYTMATTYEQMIAISNGASRCHWTSTIHVGGT